MVHNCTMTPHEWLKSIGATDSLRDIATRAGLSHATLSRQIGDGRFLMDTTLRLARAFGVSPVAALVSNGHLTPEEATFDSATSLQTATDAELVMEVARRLDVSDMGGLLDMPISSAVPAAHFMILDPHHHSGPRTEPLEFDDSLFWENVTKSDLPWPTVAAAVHRLYPEGPLEAIREEAGEHPSSSAWLFASQRVVEKVLTSVEGDLTGVRGSSQDRPTRSLRAVAKKRSKDRGGEDGQG